MIIANLIVHRPSKTVFVIYNFGYKTVVDLFHAFIPFKYTSNNIENRHQNGTIF